MNPVLSKTFTYLMLANGFAFSGWVIRNYLINWWVLEKTNSTTIVGLVAASPTLTVLLIAPLGGQLADKYSRKKIFLSVRIVSVFLFFIVALSIHLDFYALPIVVLCFLGIGVQAGFEVPAARNLILDVATFKFLTLGNELVLTPRFNPTSQMVTYLSYFRNLPRVYLLDIETGMQEVVGDFPGMTFAPRFSPDGKKIIMSFAKDGNSEIYTMDLENRIVEKITNHPSIDTSPSYSPDGKYICFNSDRSGYQQIYIMKSDGSNVKRISFGRGLYGTPVWSPRGDLIAFTKLHKGKFYIGVMRTDGSGERLLTENFYQEAPSWSPNGRVLIFYRETKTDSKGDGFSAKLWSIDLTGYNERLVNTPTDASDPSWSSLLSN